MSNSTISYEEFLQANPLARIWQPDNSEAKPRALGALPLDLLISGPSPSRKSDEGFKEEFRSKFQETLSLLQGSRKYLALMGSRSLSQGQIKAFAKKAQWQLQGAKDLLSELKSLARRLGVEERRQVRTLDGQPTWRRLTHALKKETVAA